MARNKGGAVPLKEGLLYDRNNNWVLAQGDACSFGITEPAVRKAREIAFVELPKKGQNITKGMPCGMLESIKWSGEILSPVSGTVIEANASLESDPELINRDPYGKGWIARVRLSSNDGLKGLMDRKAAEVWLNGEA